MDKSPQDFSKKILTAKLDEDNSFSVASDSAGKLFCFQQYGQRIKITSVLCWM